tara:strand:+ start:548 stop:871 length:324 start_codon:yes stop_codon:yes gene_type:complete
LALCETSLRPNEKEEDVEKYFGGPVIPTLIKLVLACVLVGIALVIFGIEPFSLWEDFLDAVVRIWGMVFDLADWAWTYFLLGAIIVIPIWLIIRFWAVIVGKRGDGA